MIKRPWKISHNAWKFTNMSKMVGYVQLDMWRIEAIITNLNNELPLERYSNSVLLTKGLKTVKF